MHNRGRVRTRVPRDGPVRPETASRRLGSRVDESPHRSGWVVAQSPHVTKNRTAVDRAVRRLPMGPHKPFTERGLGRSVNALHYRKRSRFLLAPDLPYNFLPTPNDVDVDGCHPLSTGGPATCIRSPRSKSSERSVTSPVGVSRTRRTAVRSSVSPARVARSPGAARRTRSAARRTAVPPRPERASRAR